MTTTDDLEKIVQNALKENWDEIENKLAPELVNKYRSPDILREIYPLFEHEDGKIRDLAGTLASMLNPKELSDKDAEALSQVLYQTLNDSWLAARLWAGVAIVKLKLYDKNPAAVKGVLEYVKEHGSDYQKGVASKYIENLTSKG
ncbi:MAG: hypothetical protein V1839_03100 [archaeon]